MARWLYRLGLVSARHPFRTLVAWLVVVIVAAGAMVTLQRPLSTAFELPDSDFERVFTHLEESLPEAAGGTGTVVLHSPDGFTADQRSAIEETMADWSEVSHVTEVSDPFTMQQTLDQGAEAIQQARDDLDAGWDRYDRGVRELDQLRGLVRQGRREIADIRSENPQDPTLPARIAGQRELNRTLKSGERRLDRAEQQLQTGEDEYQVGKDLSGLGEGYRLVSEDGRTALVQLRFDEDVNQLDPEVLAEIPEIGEQLADTGVEADYGQEIVRATELGGIGEVIGLVVAAIVLLVMLGSLVLAGLPLGVAFVGVGVSLMLGMASTWLFDIMNLAPVLGAMLGLAVGIDYALFIVNRHRRQLADLVAEIGVGPAGRTAVSRKQILASIALANGTAGTAVLVAGATVVIALTALCVSGIPVLVQMGLLAAATVAMTVLVALTLTPALLSLAGDRAVPRYALRSGTGSTRSGWPERWVGAVTARPALVVSAVVVVLGIAAIPALDLRLGLPDGGSEPHDSTAYQAYERIEQDFGPGSAGPFVAVVDVDQPVPAEELRSTQVQIAQRIADVPGVSNVLPIGLSEDLRTLGFQVVAEAGPSDAQTVTLVDQLRGPVQEEMADDGFELGVAGQTVANIEVSERLASALPLYLLLVVGLSLGLLSIVFRSVVVPVLATAGFLLSVAASFGAIVVVYQWGWGSDFFEVSRPGAVLSFMPTLLIGILFGLAMDYQMFLTSGMHEAYAHGERARAAVRTGFATGARVVTAAALIMISVFSGFVFSEMTMARPIALGLAVGVLIDAFAVRMTLIPAAMQLLGDRAWWMPAWLDRLLPNLDVEGASLTDRTLRPEPEQLEPADG